MDHFVLVCLDVSEYIFAFEILDSEKSGVERDPDLVKDYLSVEYQVNMEDVL